MEIENESISYSNQTDQIHMKIDQIDCKKSWCFFFIRRGEADAEKKKENLPDSID